MSEKRFVCIDIGYGDDWYITDNGKRLSEMEIVELLNEMSEELDKEQVKTVDLFFKFNELEKENEELRVKLQEKEEDEQLYANEIVKLNKEAKEVLDFKSLGGDY